MKGHAVELFFDIEGQKKLSKAFVKTKSGLANTDAMPHITLAVFLDEIEVNKLKSVTETYFENIKSFNLCLSHIGLFPNETNVIFMAPIVTSKLLDLHSNFHNELKKNNLISDALYLPDHWTPHCSITFEKDSNKTQIAVDTLKKMNLTGNYYIDRVGIVEFSPTKTISSIKLKELR